MNDTPKTQIPPDPNLLDFYAGLAMQAVLNNPNALEPTEKVMTDEYLAHIAFSKAQAMLKEREKHL